MAAKRRIIFTNNTQSDQGIMSVILGCLSIASLAFSMFFSYTKQGEISGRFGAALFLTLIFSGVGLGLGISSRRDITKFKLLPTLGIVINGLTILVLAFVLWIGLK